jgi:hypothetical protein
MRKFSLVVALVLCICLMSGCCLSHKWVEATCENPKLCEKCGETEGEALEHDWSEATRQAPKTCQVCGQTEGEPLSVYDVFPEGTPRCDDTQIFLTDQDFIELYGDVLEEEGFSLITEVVDEQWPPMLYVATAEGEMTGITAILRENKETGKLSSIEMGLEAEVLVDPDTINAYGGAMTLALDVLVGQDEESYFEEFTEYFEILGMDMETGSITVATEVSGMGFVMVSMGNVTTITLAPVNG